MEKWLDIQDFPGYEVSDHGRVRQIKKEMILAQSPNEQGVIKVFLQLGKKFYTRSVARLVAKEFHGDPPPGAVVAYHDFDKSNCWANNLEWKPRWFAQERTLQHKRKEPMRPWKILMESTGVVYKNSLECATATDGIEKYIVLAAGDPHNRRYNGSTYRWIRD